MSEIILHVSTIDEFFDHAAAVARRIDAGDDTPTTPRIGFPSIEDLWSFLTPERWTLLQMLRNLGPSSVERLSKSLGRGDQGLADDVAKLTEIGLIEEDEAGNILVPWSKITAELTFEDAA